MKRSVGVLLVLACTLIAAPASAQPADATLSYRVERTVQGTGGTYVGWTDRLYARGSYHVSRGADLDAPIRVHAQYDWQYLASSDSDEGSETRSVDVSAATRRYFAGTDLDEYDDQDGSQLETWLWVPTTLQSGDHVRILGEDFVTVDSHESVEVAGAPRVSIHVRHDGTGERHDAYGDFTTTFTDEYWFDRATGLFLREMRSETDEGTSEGQPGTFDQREHVYVVDASYALAAGEVPPDPVPPRPAPQFSEAPMLPPWGIPVAVGGVVVVAFLGIRRMLRPPRGLPQLGGQPITATPLERRSPLPASARDTTNWFGPFLPHFVDVARRLGDRVALSTLDGKVVGLAIDDGGSSTATIFTREPDVCEVLRKQLGRADFFAEMRFGNLPSVIDAANATSAKLPAGAAYNVLETYEVLELTPVPEPTFDADVVGRIEESELVRAGELLTSVLGSACVPYLQAAHAAGDLVYVAREAGAIVGVGLATVVGEHGRLHTLAVHPSHRNKGLGRELVRARLRAMSTLGAKRIVTEVSTRNPASLEIVRGEGFKAVGHMYVQTSREVAPPTPPMTVRR